MNRKEIIELLCVHSDNEEITCHIITQIAPDLVVVLYDVLPLPEPTPELAPSPRRMVSVVDVRHRRVVSDCIGTRDVEFTPVNFV